MPDWSLMSFREQAWMARNCFPTLAQQIAQDVINKWSQNTYDDTPYGEQKAISDLMSMLREASMDDVQKATERHRITQLVKDKMKLIEDN